MVLPQLNNLDCCSRGEVQATPEAAGRGRIPRMGENFQNLELKRRSGKVD